MLRAGSLITEEIFFDFHATQDRGNKDTIKSAKQKTV